MLAAVLASALTLAASVALYYFDRAWTEARGTLNVWLWLRWEHRVLVSAVLSVVDVAADVLVAVTWMRERHALWATAVLVIFVASGVASGRMVWVTKDRRNSFVGDASASSGERWVLAALACVHVSVPFMALRQLLGGDQPNMSLIPGNRRCLFAVLKTSDVVLRSCPMLYVQAHFALEHGLAGAPLPPTLWLGLVSSLACAAHALSTVELNSWYLRERVAEGRWQVAVATAMYFVVSLALRAMTLAAAVCALGRLPVAAMMALASALTFGISLTVDHKRGRVEGAIVDTIFGSLTPLYDYSSNPSRPSLQLSYFATCANAQAVPLAISTFNAAWLQAQPALPWVAWACCFISQVPLWLVYVKAKYSSSSTADYGQGNQHAGTFLELF